MKKFSTGALTQKQKQEQEERYSVGHIYDYLIIGAGMAALSAAALLARAGYRVCILEAHDTAGGYAHTFTMNHFSFCAQVHYIWGCDKDQAIGKLLRKLNLHEEITFERLNPEGYDHIILPDGKRIKTPNGFDKFRQNISAAYPGSEKNLERFFSILERLYTEMGNLPEKIRWWNYVTDSFKFLTLVKYRNKTLQNVFDECGLPLQIQAVLSANAGDLMSPPEQLSIIAYVGLVAGYNSGAYYPTKHYKFFIDRIVKSITDTPECHIYYETEATSIVVSGDRVKEVRTADGKVFRASHYICNRDPQSAVRMIVSDKGEKKPSIPSKYLSRLHYNYTQSSFFVYLGVKGIDLRDYGFGNHNTWHLEQWDMNQSWKESDLNCYDRPWIFMSTPTLHSDYPGIAPEGCQILEFGTVANYDHFKTLHDQDPPAYRKLKNQLTDKLISIIEAKHIPDLTHHIALKVVGTPTTNEDFCLAPFGNAYGSVMSPANMGLNRLKAETPWDNLYWCNASSGFASIYGTTLTGINLYQKLTGDKV